jgi:hypothetical protein
MGELQPRLRAITHLLSSSNGHKCWRRHNEPCCPIRARFQVADCTLRSVPATCGTQVAVGVLTAVQNIESGSRKNVGRIVNESCIERKPVVFCRCMRCSQRYAENRIRAEPALVGRPVELAKSLVESFLIVRVEAADGGLDFALHVAPRFQSALSAKSGLVAIAKLRCFAFPGRCSGGNFCRPGNTINQRDVDGQCGITAGIQNFKCLESCNFRHGEYAIPAVRPLVVRTLLRPRSTTE